MKANFLTLLLYCVVFTISAQNSTYKIPNTKNADITALKTDGLIQPHLDTFLKYCKKYGINAHEKLFKLREIAVVDTLKMTPRGGTLGMLVRDENKEVEKIVFSWMTLIDKEILKVVAFHEFGHYFLGYKHTCKDCSDIMAEVNPSYFEIIKNWDYQVEQLFINSPEYKKRFGQNSQIVTTVKD